MAAPVPQFTLNNGLKMPGVGIGYVDSPFRVLHARMWDTNENFVVGIDAGLI